MVKHKIFVCFMFILMFSLFAHACFADKVEAEKALVDAENDLASAYVAVGEAEKAGANVSKMLVKLKFAGTLLVDAYNASRLDDYNRTCLFAINCSESVNGIVDEALSLKLEAENAYSGRLFMTAALSSVALCVLFVLGLFGWRFLKRRYLRRVLRMKPEVREG